MREVLECAVLVAPGQPADLPAWALSAGALRMPQRLHLERFDLQDADADDEAGLLAAATMRLRRYDACLLPAEPATMPWVRMALSRARPVLNTPVLVLLREAHAPVVADLYELGAADFLLAPLCAEELRARIMHRMARTRTAPVNSELASRAQVLEALQAAQGREPPGGIQEPSAAYAAAVCSQPGPQPGAVAARVPETFREAKARVVAGFEREYLTRALERHDGNVARAARASSKHRRAFWALLRKHRIDAGQYRGRCGGLAPPGPPDV